MATTTGALRAARLAPHAGGAPGALGVEGVQGAGEPPLTLAVVAEILGSIHRVTWFAWPDLRMRTPCSRLPRVIRA